MFPDTTISRPVLACTFLAASAVLTFPVTASPAGATTPHVSHNTTARSTATLANAPDAVTYDGNGAFLAGQANLILRHAARQRQAVPPRPRPAPIPASAVATAAVQQEHAAPSPSATTAAAPAQAPPVAVSGTPQEYAQSLMAQYGWDTAQMACLIPLWDNESGWNYQATNPSSGAYGIPQALPGSKMAAAGADWQTNPDTQIRWGLGFYIKPVYGTPCAAWAHEEADGWY